MLSVLAPVPFCQVVAVDAGHLKGEWNGVMLTLSCKDNNNRLIYVATAVTPKEDASSQSNVISLL